MRFTEHEMTLAVRGAAKHLLTVAATQAGHGGGFDAETALDGLAPYDRFEVLDTAGTFVLPVLVALPDVTVEPGTRPTFTLGETTKVIDEVTRAEVAGHDERVDPRELDRLVSARLALVSEALAALPVRLDPDGLLREDDLNFTVPDTLEGL